MQEKQTILRSCAKFRYIDDMRDLVQLQSFRAVVATGSVRAAAQSLGFSPSAVSHHIKMLETDTGLLLFQRVGRGLQQTHAARCLVENIDVLLESLGKLDQRIDDLKADRTEHLTIAYFGSAGSQWLPELVAYLENKHPGVTVQLELTNGHWAADRTDIQLIVTENETLALPHPWQTKRLLSDPYILAVPNDHELAGRSFVSLDEASSYVWIENELTSGACKEALMNACAQAGVLPRFRHQAHSYAIALEMVSRGLGMTVLPRLGSAPVPEGVTLVCLSGPEPMRHIFAVHDPAHPNPALISDAITALSDLAAE